MYDLISQNIHQFRETDFQQNNPMLNLVCLRLIMKSRNGKKSHWRVIFKADQNYFVDQLAIRLWAESIFPRRLRLKLYTLEPNFCRMITILQCKYAVFSISLTWRWEKNESMCIKRNAHSTIVPLLLFVIYLIIQITGYNFKHFLNIYMALQSLLTCVEKR